MLILDHDLPVARLERVEPGRQGDDRLARLERAGIIRRGTGAVSADLLRRPLPKPKRSLVRALLEEREEGG
ncbi:MAG: hypothetical protein ACK51F_06330 [Rhodospirillales bacterium]